MPVSERRIREELDALHVECNKGLARGFLEQYREEVETAKRKGLPIYLSFETWVHQRILKEARDQLADFKAGWELIKEEIEGD